MLAVAGLAGGAGHAQEAGPQAVALGIDTSAPLGTSFTYQGRLTEAEDPVEGTCDFAFKLYNAAGGGSLLGTQSRNGVPVADGYFTVQLDFGAGPFAGQARWLEIGVDCGSGAVTLSPRQALTAAPYALYALDAPDTLEGLSCGADQIAKWNGSAWVCGNDEAGGGGSSWSLTGNAGTTPGTNYVGTTDNKALELKVNGKRALRLQPGTYSPSLAAGHSQNYIAAGVSGGTIGGGGSSAQGNQVLSDYGTVGGGRSNTVDGKEATVGGGNSNDALDDNATVGGGLSNTANAYGATVAGGFDNRITGLMGTIGGGGRTNLTDGDTGNRVTDKYGTVAGGGNNQAGDNDSNPSDVVFATVGGGTNNTASGGHTTVSGGDGNTASAESATVGGGTNNTANSRSSTVGGGLLNTARGEGATIGGGYTNTASGSHATVGGGVNNTASGHIATVAGGDNNTASGAYSFAAGRRAKALHDGTFVWADSTNANFASTAANQFLVRADNGFKVVRGASTFSSTSAALQVDQADAVEAGWFYTSNGSSPFPVLKVAKHPSAPSNFVDGVTRISSGTETRKFHIDKNGTYHAGSDFAEALPLAGDPAAYEPGDVLVISLDRPGAVDKCHKPYDGLLVGVYSTRPGFVGADKGGATEVAAGEVPVAVLGIVPVKVSAENGPVQAGDLLTTSSTPGHAMRCEGMEQCFGRTLGKALEGLPAGQAVGVIRVLISLQ
jgi:hypothetical protein